MKKKLLYKILLMQFILVSGVTYSQNIGINTTGTSPNCNSLLDLTTGNTAFNTANGNRGLLIPNISLSTTVSQTNFPTGTCAIPDGLIVFNTNTAITGTGAAGEGYYYWSTTLTRWISLVGNNANGPWLLLGNAGITNPAVPATYGTSTFGAAENWLGTTDGNDLAFGTNSIERMRIMNGTGYVGIGIANPAYQLQISNNQNAGTTVEAQNVNAGTLAFTAFTAVSNAGSITMRIGSSAYFAGAGTELGSTAAGNLYYDQANATGDHVFRTTGAYAERMRITNAGNVGIGINAPTSLLHVVDGTASYTTGTMVTVTGNSLNSGTLANFTGTTTTGNMFTINPTALTTGRGLYMTCSTLTTGNLAEIDATNATAGTTGNALYVSDQCPDGNAIWANSLNNVVNYSTIFANQTPAAVAGSGWKISQSYHAIAGQIGGNSAYTFGVFGRIINAPVPSGAVLGYWSSTNWGALGYYETTSTPYAVYGTSAGFGSGTGYMPSGTITGVGSGIYGGVLGGWTYGQVMGFVSSGEMFASYNIGNVYTSGYSAEIVAVQDKKVPAYTVTSTDIKVYNDGTGKLQTGKTHVNFDESFAQLIGNNKPVVTVTPMGQCNGVYITNVTSKGFDVVEQNNGNSDVEFSYIVVGKRIDAEGKPELPDALKQQNFDSNMKAVMHNENNTDQRGLPLWWDGTRIRFDNPPAIIKDTEIDESRFRQLLHN